MLSENLQLPPRLERCLDALERAGGRVATPEYLARAMYPPPKTVSATFEVLGLKVAVCQLRKALKVAGVERSIAVVWRRGYQLRSTTNSQQTAA